MLKVEEQSLGTTEQFKNFAIKRLFARMGEVMNGETTDHDVEGGMFFSDRRPVREAEIAFADSDVRPLFQAGASRFEHRIGIVNEQSTGVRVSVQQISAHDSIAATEIENPPWSIAPAVHDSVDDCELKICSGNRAASLLEKSPRHFRAMPVVGCFHGYLSVRFCDQVTGLISACSMTGSTGRAIGCCVFR